MADQWDTKISLCVSYKYNFSCKISVPFKNRSSHFFFCLLSPPTVWWNLSPWPLEPYEHRQHRWGQKFVKKTGTSLKMCRFDDCYHYVVTACEDSINTYSTCCSSMTPTVQLQDSGFKTSTRSPVVRSLLELHQVQPCSQFQRTQPIKPYYH